jgi:hypothetical protein
MTTWRVSLWADHTAAAAASGVSIAMLDMALDPEVHLGEVEAETKGEAIQKAFAEFRGQGVTAKNLILERKAKRPLCAWCRAPFTPKNEQQRYCAHPGATCRAEAEKARSSSRHALRQL